jgi:hypothetical protein
MMWTLLVPVLVWCNSQPDDAAAALLKQSQTRLLKAKVLEVRFDGIWGAEGKKGGRKFNGSFSLSVAGRTLSTQMTLEEKTPYKKSVAGDAFPILAREALESIGRAGVFVPFFLLEHYEDEFKEKNLWFIDARQLERSTPKLGDKEKVAGRQAQIIEYTLKSENGKLVIQNKVWIDTEQQVPMQLEVSAARGKMRLKCTERFEKLEFGQ